MDGINKVKEIFHYFNIEGDIDSVYGNWAVSSRGDIVNYLYPFSIFAIHFHDDNWIERMKEKCWFKPECEQALKQALKRAEEIMGNEKDQ
jgi:hypothetical protein